MKVERRKRKRKIVLINLLHFNDRYPKKKVFNIIQSLIPLKEVILPKMKKY